MCTGRYSGSKGKRPCSRRTWADRVTGAFFPEPPPPDTVPNCAQAGVLGVLPGIIGMLQAIETIKLIVGIGEPLIGRLLHFDALKVKFRG